MFDCIRKVEHFYFKLKPVPGTIELFNDLRQRYGNKVEILTAVPKPSRNIPSAGEDKTQWIRKFLGDGVVVNTVLRKEKANFVKNSGSILIDDTRDNIDSWNEKGGTGVLFTDAASVRAQLQSLGLAL